MAVQFGASRICCFNSSMVGSRLSVICSDNIFSDCSFSKPQLFSGKVGLRVFKCEMGLLFLSTS